MLMQTLHISLRISRVLVYAGKRFASAAKFIEFRATVLRVMHVSKFNAFWRRWYNGEHGTSITASVSQFAICDFWIAARMLRDDMLVKMIERRRSDAGTDKTSIFIKIPLKYMRIYLHNFTQIKKSRRKTTRIMKEAFVKYNTYETSILHVCRVVRYEKRRVNVIYDNAVLSETDIFSNLKL